MTVFPNEQTPRSTSKKATSTLALDGEWSPEALCDRDGLPIPIHPLGKLTMKTLSSRFAVISLVALAMLTSSGLIIGNVGEAKSPSATEYAKPKETNNHLFKHRKRFVITLKVDDVLKFKKAECEYTETSILGSLKREWILLDYDTYPAK